MDSIITTIAILLANWDERRDYLANFEPFAIDCLKRWPADQPVQSTKLSEAIAEAFHLPSLPINTVTALRDRVHRDGYLHRKADEKLYPLPVKLAGVRPLRSAQLDVLAAYHAVRQGAIAYAAKHHALTLSEHEGDQAIEQFLEEFSVEMAMARREGMRDAAVPADGTVLTVIHAFARHAIERDPAMAQNLETVVRGSMLANVIYFRDLGNWTPTLDRLVVYLDTTVAIRALGLASRELVDAAQEMVEMLVASRRPVRLFDHTLDEVIGVLDAVERGLQMALRGKLDLVFMTRQNREVIDHLIAEGWGPSSVESVIVDIETRLAELGIGIEPAPEPNRSARLDERELDRTLQKFGWRKQSQRSRDVQSLAGIHSLREGRTFRELGQAPALFVTSNEQLVGASAAFFRCAALEGKIPHCTSDISLTTQLWLRQRQKRPDVPRKVLIAESWAALNLGQDLWERFAEQLELKYRDRALSERQIYALAFSVEAREELIRATNGIAVRVDEETPSAVLAGYEERVAGPHARRADEAELDAEHVKRRRDELDRHVELQAARVREYRRELRETQTRLEALDSWKRERDRSDMVQRRGAACASIVLASGVALVLTLVLELDTPAAVVVIVSSIAALAALAISWGWRGGVRLGWQAFLGVVAVLGLPLAILGVVEGEDPVAPARPPTVMPRDR